MPVAQKSRAVLACPEWRSFHWTHLDLAPASASWIKTSSSLGHSCGFRVRGPCKALTQRPVLMRSIMFAPSGARVRFRSSVLASASSSPARRPRQRCGRWCSPASLAQHASLNARMRLRTAWHGIRILLSSFAPVLGEVSLRSSQCVMALRSYMKPSICADSTARVGARGLNGAKVRDAPSSRGRA